jgi:ABC-type lipoprotein release transport system permease subunit
MIVNGLKIFLSLFKNELLKVAVLVFLSFFIMTIIPIVINSYNKSLENSLATKQPHILVKFIDQYNNFTNDEISTLKEKIKVLFKGDDIKTINSYSKTKKFTKLKSYGYNLSEFNGYITIIGLPNEQYPLCYSFDDMVPVMLSDYGFKVTGLEIFDIFRKDNQTVFFNYTLYNSIKPLVTYEANFDFKFFDQQNTLESKANFMGIVEDFDENPIVYVANKKYNKMFGLKDGHIDGFMINIKDQKKLLDIQKTVEQFFNKNKKKVIVTNWKEINKKQNDIFKIFTQVFSILKLIIMILSTGATSIYLYKVILEKQPNLRLLNILGLRLVLIVDISVAFVIGLSVFISTILAEKFMGYIYQNIIIIDLKIDSSYYILDIFISYIILISFVIVLVNTLFKQNYNIFK